MTKDSRHHPLRHSEEDRAAAQQIPDTPQTRSDVYKLAYDDLDFLLRDELRPVRCLNISMARWWGEPLPTDA